MWRNDNLIPRGAVVASVPTEIKRRDMDRARQQSYDLLVLKWWKQSKLDDPKVRLESCNSALLLDRPALLWFQEWHLAGPSSTVISSTLSPTSSQLSIFERRLVSLLLTITGVENGLI